MYQGFAIERYRTVEERVLAPEDVLLRLLDGLLLVIAEAAEHTRRGDIPAKSVATNKALAVIGELQRALDDAAAPETAAQLRTLYGYANAQLLRGSAGMDPTAYDNANRVLRVIAGAFHEAVRK